MEAPIEAKITTITKLNATELKKAYKELFKEDGEFSHNRRYLIRKIAHRLQELEYGGISEKALRRVKELIEKYDPINNKALRPDLEVANQNYSYRPYRDKRLPIPGSKIIKMYKGRKLEVKVLERGFEFDGKIYKSLSAVSHMITGSNWNAFDFFKL
ncbi:MAG: DUF2924 domain-containing protein [Candidatus Omnitrophica bacterium]|nr:DUF2924 domain-containing protein [Candidatus Omnitrophota bacterium]